MKKFSTLIYFLIMAVMILPLSGCKIWNHGDGGSGQETHSAIAISSSALERGKSYWIYKDAVPYSSGMTQNYRYYVNDVTDNSDGRVVMNLEFQKPFSNDAFVIVDSSNGNVVFGYNPSGEGSFVNSTSNSDTETEGTTTTNAMSYTGYKNKTPQLMYYGSLNFSEGLTNKINSSFIPTILSDDEIIVINLKTDGTATLSGIGDGNVPQNDFVWHIDSSHAGEYWTDNEGTEYTDENELIANVSENEGVYVAHDIRYVPNTLPFLESQTLPKDAYDNEEMYVAYYDSGVNDDEENEYYDDNDYVIAALPKNLFESNDFESVISEMTHSQSEAYRNPVLHISKEGTYKLTGSWKGQIMVDIPDNTVNTRMATKKDPTAKVTLIFDNVDIHCTVAPALLFNKVYECGPSDSEAVENAGSFDIANHLLDNDGVYAGAVVAFADGSVNNLTGTNVARINNPKLHSDYTSSDLGKYINAQVKACKFDGALHSGTSIALGLDAEASGGTLNVTGNYAGLTSDMHMLVDSGTIKVVAEDNGVNVNEDYTSVFTMNGGLLSVTSKYGNGIASKGYVIFNDASYLNIISAQDSSELNSKDGPINAELGVHMSNSVQSIYKHSAYDEKSNNSDNSIPASQNNENDSKNSSNTNTITSDDVEVDSLMQAVTLPNSKGIVVLEIYFDDTTDKKLEKDDEGSRINASPSGSTFYLEHRVNNFSGISNDVSTSN